MSAFVSGRQIPGTGRVAPPRPPERPIPSATRAASPARMPRFETKRPAPAYRESPVRVSPAARPSVQVPSRTSSASTPYAPSRSWFAPRTRVTPSGNVIPGQRPASRVSGSTGFARNPYFFSNIMLGTTYRDYSTYRNDASSARIYISNLDKDDPDYQVKLKVVVLKETVYSRTRNSVALSATLRTTLVAGLALTFIGALFAVNPIFLLTGVSFVAVATIGLLFKGLFDKTSERNNCDLKEIAALNESIKPKEE